MVANRNNVWVPEFFTCSPSSWFGSLSPSIWMYNSAGASGHLLSCRFLIAGYPAASSGIETNGFICTVHLSNSLYPQPPSTCCWGDLQLRQIWQSKPKTTGSSLLLWTGLIGLGQCFKLVIAWHKMLPQDQVRGKTAWMRWKKQGSCGF